jgi:hypothetical protein
VLMSVDCVVGPKACESECEYKRMELNCEFSSDKKTSLLFCLNVLVCFCT